MSLGISLNEVTEPTKVFIKISSQRKIHWFFAMLGSMLHAAWQLEFCCLCYNRAKKGMQTKAFYHLQNDTELKLLMWAFSFFLIAEKQPIAWKYRQTARTQMFGKQPELKCLIYGKTLDEPPLVVLISFFICRLKTVWYQVTAKKE